MRQKYFVIAGLQRTGTTLIRDTLGRHEDILTYGEVFIYNKGRIIKRKAGEKVPHNYRKFIDSSHNKKLTHYINKRYSVHNYLDSLYDNTKYSAIGFKLMLSQVKKFPMIPEYLKENNISVIHITRENLLKTYVSRQVVRKRKVFHSNQALPPLKIQINTRKLLRRLNNIDNGNETWRNSLACNPYINVTYESFSQNRNDELERLFYFLEVKPDYSICTDLVKLNSNSLKDIIINYSEVYSCLKNTKYERCLSE